MAVSFLDLRCGDRVRVLQVECGGPAVARLEELGLTLGTEISVIKVAPMGDPIEIEFRGQRICVRRSEVTGFIVERLPQVDV